MENGHVSVEWYEKCLKYHEIEYPLWWDAMVKEWNTGRDRSHVWLIGSSSYVIRLEETMWAVDPVWLIPNVFDALSDKMEKDLQVLDFIMLTHEHEDHFMPEQIRKLRNLPVKWIVPWCMEERFRSLGLPDENCIFCRPGDQISVKGVHIEAYLGHHHYLDGAKGPESLMYTVKSPVKSLFFPADLRDFDADYIPKGTSFDAVFLHMYLNRKNGYVYPFTEYYKSLVEYAAALDTKKIFVGHLYGFQCGHPDHIWNYAHAGMLEDGLFCLRPDMDVVVPRVGKKYPIG